MHANSELCLLHAFFSFEGIWAKVRARYLQWDMGRDHKNSQSFNLCQVLGLELMSPDPLKCLGCSLKLPFIFLCSPFKDGIHCQINNMYCWGWCWEERIDQHQVPEVREGEGSWTQAVDMMLMSWWFYALDIVYFLHFSWISVFKFKDFLTDYPGFFTNFYLTSFYAFI